MTRLYQEMPKGDFSENGIVLFGTDQTARMTEDHHLEPFAAARSRYERALDDARVIDPNAGTGLEGLGAHRDFGTYKTGQGSIQRNDFRHRDSILEVHSDLPPLLRHFAKGMIRPEPNETGNQAVLAEGATGRITRVRGLARLHPDTPRQEARSTGVSNLGELEPRQNAWGYPLNDTQKQWFSPPGVRALRKSQQILATQAGDLAGIQDSFSVFPTASEALKKGYGQLFYQGGAIAITTPHGPITVVDPNTVYPTMNEALKRGFGFLYQSGSRIMVSGPAGPTPIMSAQVQAPPGPTPTADLAPAPTRPGGVFLPPPPAPDASGVAPKLGPGFTLTNPNAPTVPTGTVIATPSGPAVTTPGGGLAPVSDTSSGSPSSPSDGSAPPNAPLLGGGFGAFLSAPITLPIVGPVPTWSLLAAGVAVIYFSRKRRSSGSSEPQRNPKGKKGRKGRKGKRK